MGPTARDRTEPRHELRDVARTEDAWRTRGQDQMGEVEEEGHQTRNIFPGPGKELRGWNRAGFWVYFSSQNLVCGTFGVKTALFYETGKTKWHIYEPLSTQC